MALLSHTRGQNDSPKAPKKRAAHHLKDLRFWEQYGGFIHYVTAFDVVVLSFAAGIILYFTLPIELSKMFCGSISLAFLGWLLWLRLHRSHYKIYQNAMFLMAFSLGVTASSFHSYSQGTVFLPDFDKGYDVAGWVEGRDQGRTGTRWMIRVTSLEGYEAPPKRLRIRGKGEGVKVGDFVSVRAVMKGPLYPATPQGYNARRAAYFQGLAGSGYAVRPFAALNNEAGILWADQLQRRVVSFRYRLAERINAQSPPDTAGLQAALITGLRHGISKAHVQALRASGLAHILAISGLHMALFAGSFYSLMAFGFASIPALARGRDIRKYAAIGGIIAASFYLLISGASVATQRAYIMAVILFLAVIFDRQALSTRSVSLAALITLVLHPESLLSVGFQMSFAAVLALVVVYRYWSDWKTQQGWLFANSWLMRIRNGFVSLSVTSFVAGAATGLFAIIQFQRWAKYGLLGNLAAMPVFTFLVMPMALVTFLLLPFGLERFPLWVMGKGLDQVIWIASHIETLPRAMLAFKSPPNGYAGLYGMCFILICLGRTGFKALGIIIAMGLAFIWVTSPVPSLRISSNGYVTWQSDDGIYYTLNNRADKFGRTQFLQQIGQPNAKIEKASQISNCDRFGCLLQLKGQKIAIIETPDLLPEACGEAELVVLLKRQAGPRAKYLCAAKVIDPETLKQSGSLNVYLTPDSWRIKQSRARAINRKYTSRPKDERREFLYQTRRPWD